MGGLTVFEQSRLTWRGRQVVAGRVDGRDVILAEGGPLPAEAGLRRSEAFGRYALYSADYDNVLAWERTLAPEPRLVALHRSGHARGFGAGNRIVISVTDGPSLRSPGTFGGWDGIFAAMLRSPVPYWFVQQSIVRELIPEGVDPAEYPGIGHTGGYGPREFLRAGLFALAGLGGYSRYNLPIGADADHAILVGHDEESLQRSLAFNKLAMSEARDCTKFTVDTSHLFDFPVSLGPAEERRLRDAFRGRRFAIGNVVAGRPGYEFEYDDEEVTRLGRRYWRAAAVHRELYDHVLALRGQRPFDYELSLDETPSPTPPRDLLFYLVLLQEVMGLPAGGVASAGPNIGFTKRHDFEGDLFGRAGAAGLREHTAACASILRHFGAVLSVHSADGVRAATGKGPGVDAVVAEATGGDCEIKVADVYQEVLWQVLAASPEPAERDIFQEGWRRTYEAAEQLAAVYGGELAGMSHAEAQRLLAAPDGRERVRRAHGKAALSLAQGAIGYGLPLFALAARLLPGTDRTREDAESELFRRFMFLTYRGLRPAIFATLDAAGWQRLSAAVEQATMTRIESMGWSSAR